MYTNRRGQQNQAISGRHRTATSWICRPGRTLGDRRRPVRHEAVTNIRYVSLPMSLRTVHLRNVPLRSPDAEREACQAAPIRESAAVAFTAAWNGLRLLQRSAGPWRSARGEWALSADSIFAGSIGAAKGLASFLWIDAD